MVQKITLIDWIPVLLVVASFGPYVFPSVGLRSEHFLIYSMLLFAVPSLVMRRRIIQLSQPLFGIIVLLLGITLWTLFVPISGEYPVVSFYKYLSSIENYVQPIAVVLVVIAFSRFTVYDDILRSFKNLCLCLVFLLCLNSIIACCSIFFDLSNFMRPFVESCFGGPSVWQLSEEMGRHPGIFNQPIESGLMYSLGLLALGYLNRVSHNPGFISGLSLAMLIIGGILSVSKVFIMGGILVFLFYWNPFGNLKKYFKWRYILALIIGYSFICVIFSFWKDRSYFFRLFKIERNTNLIELYTGGRFGAENNVPVAISAASDVITPATIMPGGMITSRFIKVWQVDPLHGFGFGTTSCYDNAYLEFFHQGGMIALFGYLVLLVVYLWYSLRAFLNGYEEGRLLLALFVLVMGASLGAPVLTINRFSAVFWVFSTLLFLIVEVRNKAELKKTV
jgi:hypothetical protein